MTICALLLALIFFFPAAAQADPAQPGPAGKTNPASTRNHKPAEGKWLPVPLFLTEPAFGYGLGVGLAYIHPHNSPPKHDLVQSLKTSRAVTAGRSGQRPPPDITGFAAGYTDNDTWFGAIGHGASIRNDTIRYAGALAYADVKSTYYILDHPFDFSLKGLGIYQELKFRLGPSRFFLGGKLAYLETESAFETTIGTDTGISLGNISARDVGLALEASFDGRDNIFTPNRGLLTKLAAWRYSRSLGGDYDYWKGTLKILSFHQVLQELIVGLRLEGSAVDGNPPFYAYPWVTLRGIPALRYQGKGVAMAEVECRWNILPRWALVGFAGLGGLYGKDPAFKTEDRIIAGGFGGRYLFMPEEGLWVGADISHGPEDWYWYINVGQAW